MLRRHSLVVLMFAFLCPGALAASSTQETELYDGLLAWAVKLSGYQVPVEPPTIEFVPQEFFNANACGGRRCRVWGWYPNTGKHVVYVHEAARALIGDGSDPRSLLAASIVVHEFTHYLQAVNRSFARYECEDALKLEREAYNVQNAYIVAYGRYMHVGISMQNAGCGGSASEASAAEQH